MLTEHILFFFICGLTFAVPFILACRWASGAWFSPLVVNGFYIGLGGAFIGLIHYDESGLAIVAAFGFVFYLTGLLLAWRSHAPKILQEARRPVPISFLAGCENMALCVMMLLVAMNILFIPAILKSGIGLTEISSFRYIIRQDAKFPFLLYSAIKVMALFPLIVLNKKRLLFWAAMVYVFCSVPTFLLGSKGALVGVFFDLLIIYYMRAVFLPLSLGKLAARPERSWITRSIFYGFLVALLIIIIGPLGLVYVGKVDGYSTAANIIFSRVLGSFDSVFFAVEAGVHPNGAGFQLFDWWFASPLKVVGYFNSSYNAMNEFVMSAFYAKSNVVGMFPNNFQVMEAVVTLPAFVSPIFLLFSGYLYGLFTMWLARRRFASPLMALAFVVFIANPYSMLIDGQSFWTNLIIILACFFGLFILSSFLTRSRS